jgi:hypothetical protein
MSRVNVTLLSTKNCTSIFSYLLGVKRLRFSLSFSRHPIMSVCSWMAKIALYGKYVCRPARKQIILLAIIGSVFARPVSCSGSLRAWIHLGFVLITEPAREEELKRWGLGRFGDLIGSSTCVRR